jgi:uncharacterized protein YkwD
MPVHDLGGRAVRGWLAASCVLAALLWTAGSAVAAPKLLSTKLSAPAVVGQPSGLKVRAEDPSSPVAGATASYGREGAFGLSACLAPDSAGHGPGRPFTAGSPVTFALPHTFTRAGALEGVVRVDAGGCLAPADSIFQPFTATPVSPGQSPKPLVLGAPVPLSEGGTAPSLPGGGGLPPLPAIPSLPSTPTLPTTPTTPTLPTLPSLPLPLVGGAEAARAACPGASRRIRRTAKSRAKAGKATLCLLNRERRARHLKPLHSQHRLFVASFRQSRAMVKKRFFSHVQPGGVGLLTRLVRTHYLPSRSWLVGENIAFGAGSLSSPLQTVRAWMNSTGHRANILRPKFRQIGVGIYPGVPTNSRSGATYTTDFGVRR